MCNSTQKKKEITSFKDHITCYNIVNVCKNTIVNDDKELQNYIKADLPGLFSFNVYTK